MLTGKGIIVATTLRVSYEECPVVVFWQQQLLLCLYTLYLAEVPSVTDKTTGDYSVHRRSHELGGCWSIVSLRCLTVTGSGQPWLILEPGQTPIQCVNWSSVGYPGILFGGRGGSTNSVEDRENGDLVGGSPLVRGSGGSCNLVQEISFHIVKFY